MSEFLSLVANLRQAVAGNEPIQTTNNGSRICHERAVELRRRMVDVVRRNVGITTIGVAEILEISRECAHNHLNKAAKLGFIHRRTGRFSGWEVSK